MNEIHPIVLQSIANMTLLCMKYSTSEFEINMSLYPTKNELNVYVYKGGYEYAWKLPQLRIQRTRIDLSTPQKAISEMHSCFSSIEKMVKQYKKEPL